MLGPHLFSLRLRELSSDVAKGALCGEVRLLTRKILEITANWVHVPVLVTEGLINDLRQIETQRYEEFWGTPSVDVAPESTSCDPPPVVDTSKLDAIGAVVTMQVAAWWSLVRSTAPKSVFDTYKEIDVVSDFLADLGRTAGVASRHTDQRCAAAFFMQTGRARVPGTL